MNRNSMETGHTAVGGNLSRIGVLLAAGILTQAGHDGLYRETEIPSTQNSVRGRSMELLKPDERERLEKDGVALTNAVRNCADLCSASEATALAKMCGKKPLLASDLTKTSSTLSPELRSAIHKIAEVLERSPELAPNVLTELHTYLDALPMTDPRKLAGLFIPSSDPSLSDTEMISLQARKFLILEGQNGAYNKQTVVMAGINVFTRQKADHTNQSDDDKD